MIGDPFEDMAGDPYKEAEEKLRAAEEAKLVTPKPAQKSRKIVIVGGVLAALLLLMICAGAFVSFLFANRETPATAARPTTMSKRDSDSFGRQQSGQAAYMKGLDKDHKNQNAQDTILGKAGALAGDSDGFDEADGVPKKTKAQDDAEHGHGTQSASKSEAQIRSERLALESAHRRQNDLDSSPVSVDFSDYFDREKTAAAAGAKKPESSDDEAAAVPELAKRHKRPALQDDDATDDSETAKTETVSNIKPAHDPKEDFEFDSSAGKLYRLMEDTVIENVLVNRLAGAAIGPVIVAVTTDVYSQSGAHLLIPKGTRILGRVSAVSGLNQERLFVAFHRMIMPDGYSVSLDKFQGLDVVGQTGLRDLVNHHYVRIFGASLALAAVAATTQIGNTGASFGTYDWGVSMRNGASQGLGQSAQRVLERFMDTLPTFTIRERSRVKVMLAGDLLLPDTKNHTMDPDL